MGIVLDRDMLSPCPGFTQKWFPIAYDSLGSLSSTQHSLVSYKERNLEGLGGRFISVFKVAVCALDQLNLLQ